MIRRRDLLKGGAAALIVGAGRNSPAETQPGVQRKASTKASRGGHAVTFDERSVLVNGQRVLLSCGEIHYPRSTRAMWPTILKRSKALGLNTITTYVFWNFHETSRGVFDFTGERDLGHYLDLCHENGLNVFLRVGPYICAEWNYGGFPPYLRDEPGITIRTMNKAYTARVEAYYERLAEVVKPRLASNGGPVVLVQVENEYTNVAKRYGEQGQEYLRWIVDLATRVGFAAVPTTTCEGGAQGAIETSNGFMISADRIAAVRKSHPGTPLLWTELYPAWYRVWGGGIAPGRDPRTMAGSILDFVSRGGSGWNYYPWQGGTNFGRNAMYLQTTTYDFFAPLDEYGDVTETGVYLGRLHAVLEEHKTALLEGERSDSVTAKQRTTTWTHGSEELRLIQEDYYDGPFDFQRMRTMNIHGRLVDKGGHTLFNLDAAREEVARSFSAPAWKPVPQEGLEWLAWDEPVPKERQDAGLESIEPIEQLSMTKDATDYCWYSTTLNVGEAGPDKSPQEIVIPYGGDFFYVYVDGTLVATSKQPLEENRGPITPEDPAHPRIVVGGNEKAREGFRHSFTLSALEPGAHRLDLLAVAMGMVKGDWQIASSMDFERKGIWQGVLWNGLPLQNWIMRPGLVGETHIPTGIHKAQWRTASDARPLRWHKCRMQVPTNMLRGTAVFQIDAAGLSKGMIWVNGHAVGRHWLIEASRPPKTPSQRYYHVPADWLRASNEVVILEEQAASPTSVRLLVRV